MPVPFLCILAFVLFWLATDRQHRRRLGRPLPARRAAMLRTGAWLCLAAGFAGSIAVWGSVIGPVAWTGVVMIAAALTFLVVNFVLQR